MVESLLIIQLLGDVAPLHSSSNLCSLYCSYVPNPVLVIIDVQPKELGIPTKAYYAIEEVKEVSISNVCSCAVTLTVMEM